MDEELQQLKSSTRLPGRNVGDNIIRLHSHTLYSPHDRKKSWQRKIYIHILYIYLVVMYDYIYYQEHGIFGLGWVTANFDSLVGCFVGRSCFLESGFVRLFIRHARFLVPSFGCDAGRCADSMG